MKLLQRKNNVRSSCCKYSQNEIFGEWQALLELMFLWKDVYVHVENRLQDTA